MPKAQPIRRAPLQDCDEDGDDSQHPHAAGAHVMPVNSRVAWHMFEYGRKAHSGHAVEELSKILKCTPKKANKLLLSVAETCALGQSHTLRKLLEYARSRQASGALKALQFVYHVSFDETPLRLRLAFRDTGRKSVQLAKLYAVESGWAMLLQMQDSQEFLRIHGTFSPSLRCADANSANAIAAVLESVKSHQLPDDLDPKDIFQASVRVAESDELMANLKAEREWVHKHPCTHLHLVCLAHKLHSVCEKTVDLVPELWTGTVRTLLCAQSGSNLSKLEASLLSEIPQRLEVLYHTTLSEDAQRYRKNCLELWLQNLPARKQAVISAMAGTVLNGDWRISGKIQHICCNCCESYEDTLGKALKGLPKLLRVLRPGSISRSNWADWSPPLAYIAVLSSIHGLLPDLYKLAFAAEEDPAYLTFAECRVGVFRHLPQVLVLDQPSEAFFSSHLCGAAGPGQQQGYETCWPLIYLSVSKSQN